MVADGDTIVLDVKARRLDGTIVEASAINEVSLLRETRQTAKLRISVDGVVRLVGGPVAERARQIAQYPWFVNKKPWQKEIELMLKNGFKLEVEALISKDISYVTEQYTPARLKARDWLD